MDCSLPGSSIHGIFQARVLEWGCHFLLQGIFPTQRLNPGLLHCRQTLLQSELPEKPQRGRWTHAVPACRWLVGLEHASSNSKDIDWERLLLDLMSPAASIAVLPALASYIVCHLLPFHLVYPLFGICIWTVRGSSLSGKQCGVIWGAACNCRKDSLLKIISLTIILPKSLSFFLFF